MLVSIGLAVCVLLSSLDLVTHTTGMWCKHTNFEPAARAPMLIHAPGMAAASSQAGEGYDVCMPAGLTDDGIFSMEYTEHIDLMPTLAELAMNATVPACPDDETIL